MAELQQFSPLETIKIYIGQLPLQLEEHELKSMLEPYAPVKDVKIIKGDSTRGRFDLFCYAFVNIRGNEATAQELIKRIQQLKPNWKMNIKYEQERKRVPKMYPTQNYPPNMPPPYAPYPPMPRPYPNYMPPPHFPQPTMGPQQVIIGEKPCNILVRQLWIGGIPEHFDKGYMSNLMAYYGIIEQIEMFHKFAFIKYKQVIEATNAYERAQQIYQRLGNPIGFKVAFSDPLRRASVVSNNYEFEKQSVHVPIVFIGFPPITSATVDMDIIKSVVSKILPVTAEYMRKNTNNQNRSYFLFSFQSVKSAIKVKQELTKRKDLLGDKRAQISVLIDEVAILKGKDLSHTQKLFQADPLQDKKKNPYQYAHPMMMAQPMGYPMYPGPMYQPYPPAYYPPNFYYQQQQYYHPKEGDMYNNLHPHPHAHMQQNHDTDHNIHDFLKDVLAGDKDQGNEKKPVKTAEPGREEDILSKLLGNDTHLNKETEKKEGKEEREPTWSGFLTWKSNKRVCVDGHSSKIQLEDYSINVLSTIEFKDIVLKDRNTMVLECSNTTGIQAFKEYIKMLKTRVGVAMGAQYLMYLMGKSEESDKIEKIGDEQLLVVFQKGSTLTLIKDKLIKPEDLP